MIKLLKRVKDNIKNNSQKRKSVLLRKKVEEGTEKAIKEYGYVFKKLAEFDRK